jgi:hypothetical protein
LYFVREGKPFGTVRAGANIDKRWPTRTKFGGEGKRNFGGQRVLRVPQGYGRIEGCGAPRGKPGGYYGRDRDADDYSDIGSKISLSRSAINIEIIWSVSIRGDSTTLGVLPMDKWIPTSSAPAAHPPRSTGHNGNPISTAHRNIHAKWRQLSM